VVTREKPAHQLNWFLVTRTVAFGTSCDGKVGGTYVFGTVDGKSFTVNSAFVSYFACPPVGPRSVRMSLSEWRRKQKSLRNGLGNSRPLAHRGGGNSFR